MSGLGNSGPESERGHGTEGAPAGSGEGPHVRPNNIKDREELIDDAFSFVMEHFKKARTALTDAARQARREAEPDLLEAEKFMRELLSGAKGKLDVAGTLLSQVFQPESTRKALEASAHIWTLIQSSGAADGYVRRPDGTPISAKFEGFEGMSMNVAGEQRTVTIGKLGGKEYLLSLRDPSDLSSSVVMGNEGWDDLQAYGRVIVAKRGAESYLVNPATGGAASTEPLSSRSV